MASRIPTYQRQVQISGDLPVARANSVVSPGAGIGGALSQVGQQGMQLATAMMQVEAQKNEDVASVQVSNLLSSGDTYWQENTANRFKSYKVGDPDMQEGIEKDFNAWKDEQAGKLTTTKARQYFEVHANSLKERLKLGAFKFQENVATGKLNAESAAGEQEDENNVFRDPSSLDAIYTRRMEPTMARKDLTEAEKIKFGDLYKRKLFLAAERGELEKDPAAWYARRFGTFKVAPGGASISTESLTVSGATAGGKPAVSLPTDSKLPAGMRNNNPGNIKFVGQKDAVGPSKNTDQGDPQAVYATPEDGTAAMYKLALKKYDGGKTTANSLIAGQGGWTPGNKAAAANIAKTMGIGPDDNLNLRDPASLQKFARALLLQEHGKASMAYTDEMLSSVAGSVLTGKPIAASPAAAAITNAAPTSMRREDVTGPAPVQELIVEPKTFAGMDYEQRIALKNQAETKIKQGEAQFKAGAERSLSDAVAMHKDGIQDSFNFQRPFFDRTYGPDGGRMFDEYQKSRTMAQDISQFKTQSEAEIRATLDASKPKAGEGYATEDARYNVRMQAAAQVMKQRQADPAGYATSNSETLRNQRQALDRMKPEDPGRPAMVQKFTADNLAEQTRLGIQSPEILTPGQADAIANRAMTAAKPEDAANLIASLEADYGPQYFPKVLAQLTKDNKLPPEMMIIPNLPTQTARELVSRMARIKETDLTAGIDAAGQKEVKDAVTGKLEGFARAIPALTGQAVGVTNAYETTMRKIAYQFVLSGQTPSDAANRAYDLVLGQYTFDGTIRYPKTVNQGQTQAGVRNVMNYELKNLDVPMDLTAARKPDEAKKEWENTVKARPLWFTRDDDNGLELWAQGNNGVRYRVKRGGAQVAYTWDQLSAMATPKSTALSEREKKAQNKSQMDVFQGGLQ